MSKGNVTENDLVKFFANGTAMPSYGSTWYMHLHTADPGEAGTSSSSEANYPDYARIAVSRDVAGFTVCDADGTPNASGSAFKNAAEITFIECNASYSPSTQTLTHASLCSSTGQIIYKGALTTPIVVGALNTPRIVAGGAIFKEN
jgi:hypothetical protein